MNEQKILDGQVRQWEAEGWWVDRGRWVHATNGTPEYIPTKREIAAKCRLFRTINGWRGGTRERSSAFALVSLLNWRLSSSSVCITSRGSMCRESSCGHCCARSFR